MVGSGVSADTENFTEYIQKNMKLYSLDNDINLSTHAAANFVRSEVHNNYFMYFAINYVNFG